MRRSLGTKGRSDSKDGNLCGQQTRRRVLVWSMEQRGWNHLNRGRSEREPVNHSPVKVDGLTLCGNLGVLVGLDLSLAAASLSHLSALAVHGGTAGILRMAHRITCYAGKNRRCSRQQKNQCEDARKAAHGSLHYRRSQTGVGQPSEGSEWRGNTSRKINLKDEENFQTPKHAI